MRWRNSWEGWASMVLSGGVSGSAAVAALRCETGEVEEIGEQGMPMLGGNAFGMELHPVHGMVLVLQAHDEPFGLCGDEELVGQAVTLHHQGVIAGHLEAFGQGPEYPLAGVADARQLAMH